MKKFLTMQSAVLVCMFAAAALVASRASAQVEGTIITQEGREMPGLLSWKGSQKVYIVRNGPAESTVSLDQVRDLRVKTPPAGLAALIQQVQEGRAVSSAIPALKQIFDRYDMLQYDIVAGRWLAEAYSKSGQLKDAVSVCEKLTRDNPAGLADAGLASTYTAALLALDQVPQLKNVLQSIIKQGSRDAAAVALIRRGDLEVKRNGYRDALIDGYLRVIVLFEDIKPVQPEALYKASLCFDQLNQATYAERMRKKLLQTYPQDPLAAKIKAAGK